MNKPIDIIYIAGWGRSGSTLLEQMLGQVPGLLPCGELRGIWDRNLVENQPCSCGQQLLDCPVWQPVLEKLLLSCSLSDLQDVLHSRELFTRTRSIWRHLQPHFLHSSKRKQFASQILNLYREINEQNPGSILIDSSKYPTYGLFLSSLPGIRLHTLHLVRDPRAVAFSWQRPKLQPSGDGMKLMEKHSAVRSSLLWVEWNIVASTFLRWSSSSYYFMRYEDLVSEPQRILSLALNDLHVPFDETDLNFISPDSLQMKGVHTTSGNPARFSHGRVMLREDLQWCTDQSRRDRIRVEMIAGILMRKYGYRPGGF